MAKTGWHIYYDSSFEFLGQRAKTVYFELVEEQIQEDHLWVLRLLQFASIAWTNNEEDEEEEFNQSHWEEVCYYT